MPESNRRGRRPVDKRALRRCSRCGQWKRRSLKNFKPAKTCRQGLSGVCRSCSSEYMKLWKSKNRARLVPRRRELYERSERVIEARRSRARWRQDPIRMRAQMLRKARYYFKQQGVRVDPELLTTGYWVDMLRKNPTCECCNKPFRMTPDGSGTFCNDSPSVDRLRPSKGYVSGNIALLCWRCNNLKRDATPNELETVAGWMKSRGL